MGGMEHAARHRILRGGLGALLDDSHDPAIAIHDIDMIVQINVLVVLEGGRHDDHVVGHVVIFDIPGDNDANHRIAIPLVGFVFLHFHIGWLACVRRAV